MCDQSFRQQGTLKNHMYTHDGGKPYQCPHCDQGYTQRTKLKAHILTHTRNTNRSFLRCSQCSKVFHKLRTLEKHISRWEMFAHEILYAAYIGGLSSFSRNVATVHLEFCVIHFKLNLNQQKYNVIIQLLLND